MSKKSYLTATDQFCGAGGSSVGATAAGVELRLALNHWELAIETHNSNFPDAMHDCTDISACDPRRYPSTDILITSPECTNHSLAKGKRRKWQRQLDLWGTVKIDPAEERSRATMWDVPRFAEHHRYNLIIVENVVEARHWALWDAWLHAMRLLGYEHTCVYFNSMFAYPTPQSRDRMYVVFWRKGNRTPNLDIRPTAWCVTCQANINAVQVWKNSQRRWGRYRQQYLYHCPACEDVVNPYYYCAANAIDWSLPAQRIGDRLKPLKEKTLNRIRVGLEKFGCQAQTIELAYTGGHDNRSLPITKAMVTQTARQTQALMVPPYMVDLRGQNAPKELLEALSTVCASGNHHGLVIPSFITSYYGTGGISGLDEAMPTVPTRDRHAIVMPPMLIGNYSPGWARPVTDPTGTITTADHHSVLMPPFLVSYYTRLSGIGAAVSGMDKPVPVQPTWPVHYLVQPGETPAVEDCGFRMLQPHEIHKAMAFPDEYVVLGNARDRVKQYGNAVTPPVMRMLIERCVASLM